MISLASEEAPLHQRKEIKIVDHKFDLIGASAATLKYVF